MEVHAHSHTERKKWHHYFWEFFMLFLAVTLGFFVENWREHIIEHRWEKQYVSQLLVDLRKDTAYFNLVSNVMKKQLKTFDSSNILLDQKPPLNNADFIRLVLPLRTTYPVTSVTTTFNQMKNSGSLRFIRNFEINSKLARYYDRTIPQLTAFFQNTNDYYRSSVEPFILQHFDLSESDFNTDSLKTNSPIYFERNEKSDFIIKNLLIKYRNSLNFVFSETLVDANNEARELIRLIESDY
jgi:hypothetical protein